MAQPPVPGYSWFPTPDPLISPDYSGWWQRAIEVVKASYRQLIWLQLIVAVISFVLQGFATVAQVFALRDIANARDVLDDPPAVGAFLAAFGTGFIAVMLGALVSMLVSLAAVRVVIVTATGGTPSVRDSLAHAGRRVFPLVGWSILAGLITVAGICACVLPVFYFIAVFTVLTPVVAIERSGAISRCFSLFHGSFSAAVGRVATIIGLGFAGSVAAFLIGVIGDVVAPAETAPIAAAITSGIIASAFGAVIAAGVRIVTDPLTVAAYADMRARIEPLNSAMLRQQSDYA